MDYYTSSSRYARLIQKGRLGIFALAALFILITSYKSSVSSSQPPANEMSSQPGAAAAVTSTVPEGSDPDDAPTFPATNIPLPATTETSAGVEKDEFLAELARDTWAYLGSDWARSNHMPWSWRSETMSGGDYANTAEIGFLALSWLAAHDRAESWSPPWEQTESEVIAILDQLRAWQTGSQPEQPNGPNAYANSVFYQWYWINQSPPVVSGNPNDHLVPSIDNAWLAASLIVIREYALTNDHPALRQKADDILQDMDFMLWYDANTHLFTWGAVEDPQGGAVADHYSNENRMINFVARALGQMTPEEYEASLDALARPVGTYGDITVAAMAWDGSYFTYSTPALFIREMDQAYGMDTILPATRAQIAYAQDEGYEAWGLSDCYDVKDGGYVQQGALPANLIPPETRPGLVTPHAGALALITPLSAEAITNLQAIADSYDCSYDDLYGFRDSIMVNPAQPDYEQCSGRFSALAQEWIFLALVNHNDGFIWRYFYNNSGVRQAHSEMFDDYLTFAPIIIVR